MALGSSRRGGPRHLAGGRVSVLFRLFFSIFFGMMRRWLHHDDRIRSSRPYPRSSGASSASGVRVEFYVRWISWDPVRLRIRLCGYKFGSSDLQFSSLALVTALLRWSIRALARRLPVRLLQQALLRQVLPGSGDGGARTAACLRLAQIGRAHV